MAKFDDHILQSKKNLLFLDTINKSANEFWDWQVTTCFYVGVHLIGALLAETSDIHYESHTETFNALNPNNRPEIPNDLYLSYRKLFNNSIRSRYLNIPNTEKTNDYDKHIAYITHDKHLRKSIEKLDTILLFMTEKYKIKFDVLNIDCIELRKISDNLSYFKYKKL